MGTKAEAGQKASGVDGIEPGETLSPEEALFAVAVKALEEPDDFGPDDVREILTAGGLLEVWDEAVAYVSVGIDEEEDDTHDPELSDDDD